MKTFTYFRHNLYCSSKSIITALFLVVFALSSCSKIDLTEEESTQQEEAAEIGKGELYVTCTFSQTQGEIEDTRATTPLYECATRVVFVLMKNGKIYDKVEQINGGGNSFGTLSLELEAGTYQLLVFAHNSNSSVNVYDDGSITFAEGLPTDCFSYSTEVVITTDKRKAVSCKLTRSVCEIILLSKSTVQQDVAKAQVTFTGISTQYDLLHQLGGGTTDFNIILYPSEFTDEDGYFFLDSYFFLPSLESLVSAQITFFDSSDAVICQRELDGIQAKINVNTIVTANLSPSNGIDASNITVDTEWGSTITQSF